MCSSVIINILDLENKSIGTGFFVSSKGHLLTCKHIIENAGYKLNGNECKVKYKYENSDDIHQAKVIIFNDNEDIVVLLSDVANNDYIPLCRRPPIDEVADIYGFPQGSKEQLKACVRIDKNSNGKIQLGNANNVTFGFSGAPIIYDDAVVGVVDAITKNDSNVRLINVAFAISAEHILDKLSKHGVVEEKMICVGYGNKANKCMNYAYYKDQSLCKTCFKEQFQDSIKAIYSAQNYEIIDFDDYFIIKLQYGISTYYDVVFTIVKFDETLVINDLIHIVKYIDNINYTITQVIVVTNAETDVDCKEYSKQQKIIIKTKEDLVRGIFDFKEYRNDLCKYTDSQQLASHYIELFGTKGSIDEEEINDNYSLTEDTLDYFDFDFDEDEDYGFNYDSTDYIESSNDEREELNDNASGMLLKEYVDCFLASKHKALLILGDYGSGKTSFCYNYALELLDLYMCGKTRYLPILIKLRGYNKALSISQLLTDYFINELKITNFNIEALKMMLKNIDVLLIFDGYDEVAKKVDFDIKYEVLKEICSFAEDKTKLIVTCRPNYFQNASEFKRIFEKSSLQYEPGDEPFFHFIENTIAELTPMQIDEYIKTYQDTLKEYKISIAEIIDTIKSTHDLTDLAKRPFLLYMIISTVPQIIRKMKDKEVVRINAAKLYSVYTNNWIKREERKNKTLIKQHDKDLFCKEVAFQMYITDTPVVSYKELPETVKNYFKDIIRIEEVDYFTHDIQSCSFLTSDRSGEFKFIHRSFMEFFVADKIITKLNEYINEKGDGKIKLDEVLGQTYLSMEICLFINDMIDKQNYYIIDRIASQFEDVNPISKNNIISIVSKTDTNMSNFLSNITFCNDYFLHADFTNAYFDGGKLLNLPFHDIHLYSVIFDKVTFVDCDFSNVSFEKTRFKEVEFYNCNFSTSEWKDCTIEKCIMNECILVDNLMEAMLIQDTLFTSVDFSGTKTIGYIASRNNSFENSFGIPYEFE